jgi:acyl-coenzyme A synthetase/AMP-(fatty) acid ligase
VLTATYPVLPLLTGEDSRPIAWRQGRAISLAEFKRDIASIARELPASGPIINLCEDRYHFLASFAAALSVQRTSLLPPSRVEQVVAEVELANAGSCRIDDENVARALQGAASASTGALLDDRFVAMIGYTSGSTGQPKANVKRWRAVHGTSACNAAAIRSELRLSPQEAAWIAATVPPQHMYGMELSVLLPLIGTMAVHAGRPLFPADVAATLAELPELRFLL